MFATREASHNLVSARQSPAADYNCPTPRVYRKSKDEWSFHRRVHPTRPQIAGRLGVTNHTFVTLHHHLINSIHLLLLWHVLCNCEGSTNCSVHYYRWHAQDYAISSSTVMDKIGHGLVLITTVLQNYDRQNGECSIRLCLCSSGNKEKVHCMVEMYFHNNKAKLLKRWEAITVSTSFEGCVPFLPSIM